MFKILKLKLSIFKEAINYLGLSWLNKLRLKIKKILGKQESSLTQNRIHDMLGPFWLGDTKISII